MAFAQIVCIETRLYTPLAILFKINTGEHVMFDCCVCFFFLSAITWSEPHHLLPVMNQCTAMVAQEQGLKISVRSSCIDGTLQHRALALLPVMRSQMSPNKKKCEGSCLDLYSWFGCYSPCAIWLQIKLMYIFSNPGHKKKQGLFHH